MPKTPTLQFEHNGRNFEVRAFVHENNWKVVAFEGDRMVPGTGIKLTREIKDDIEREKFASFEEALNIVRDEILNS